MNKEGGFYLKPRCDQDSPITHAPPYIREIYDWLNKEANHKDKKYGGFTVKRGQLFRTYNEIRDGLAWKVGYRKERYSENHVKKAMAFLRKELLIATMKELGGVLITVLNYNETQNPKNYESTNERTNERTNAEPMRNQPIPDNNKNEKNERNIISKEIISSQKFSENSIEIKLANLLLEKILINNPTAKLPNLQKWAAEFDKMLRKDSRTERQIEYLISWTQQHDFWKLNILSPFKLRKHWDQLVLQAKNQYEQQNSNLAIIS